MTDPTPAHPTLDEREWDAVSTLVHRMLQRHPLMAPLLEHYRFIQIQAHERSIWAQVGSAPNRPGYGLYEARIDAARWWQSGMETREDWARRLTVRLAKELRGAWDSLNGGTSFERR